MAKVTKIKAKETDESPKKEKKVAKPVEKKPVEKKSVEKKSTEKKPFILWRPLVYLGRYIRDSWREIRQVCWPNRKTTWQMVFAVVVYTAIFMIFILLLDLLFSWLAGLVFGTK